MPGAPRSDPYVRISRIRLPPRMITTEPIARGSVEKAPDPAPSPLAHTATGITWTSGTEPGPRPSQRVLLGQASSLHDLRQRIRAPFVRSLHRYHTLVRLPAPFTPPSRLLVFGSRLTFASVHGASRFPSPSFLRRCGSQTAGRRLGSRNFSDPCDVAFTLMNRLGP